MVWYSTVSTIYWKARRSRQRRASRVKGRSNTQRRLQSLVLRGKSNNLMSTLVSISRHLAVDKGRRQASPADVAGPGRGGVRGPGCGDGSPQARGKRAEKKVRRRWWSYLTFWWQARRKANRIQAEEVRILKLMRLESGGQGGHLAGISKIGNYIRHKSCTLLNAWARMTGRGIM